MIIKFSVQNFGSIKDEQTLSFEANRSTHLEDYFVIHTSSGERLLKMALIYGANASGKTTTLKALDFLRDIVLNPEDKKTDELNFDPFLFDDKTPSENSILSIEFIQQDVKYFYKIEFFKKAIVKEELYFFKPKKANVFKRVSDISNQFTKITFGSKMKIDKVSEKTLESNTLWNNSVLGGFLKTNIDINELKQATDWFKDYLNGMVHSKTDLEPLIIDRIEKSVIKKADIVNILKKADFNISNVSIGESEPMPDDVEKLFKALDFSDEDIERLKKNPPKKVEFEHTIGENKFQLSIEKESEGTKRYFEFAGLLCMLINSSTAFPIDELEASLHPELYLNFILSFLINSKSSQVIATTHNRELLGNNDIFRDDSIWITDKDETCSTRLYSLADFDSSVIRDSTNRLNAYKSGKLGGVPHLGDYYLEIDK